LNGERLDGWKAIAAYLNRSVRQCQRLAESRGLPVHHLPGTRSVFAYTGELDRWLLGLPEQTAQPPEMRLSRSGRHVVLPVETLESNPGSTDPAARKPTGQGSGSPHRRASPLLVLALLGLLGGALLTVAALGRHEPPWYEKGFALSGVWSFSGPTLSTQSATVVRFDTGHRAGPGTEVAVTLVSSGARWSGGVEIFSDDLHWTFVSISPREHQILVQRFPVGTVTAFPMGPLVDCARPVRLRLVLTDSRLEISCDDQRTVHLSMDPWDVMSGRLLLRVGTPGDEIHEPAGGTCAFRDLQVRGEPATLPPAIVQEVPAGERPSADYVLTVTDIDDQVDVLIDGRRLASARYRETIGPMSITPFLDRGPHTLTALVFNRKWTASYRVSLTRNGTEIWHEACGSVTEPPYGCEAIGQRLGMVRRLSFTFTAR